MDALQTPVARGVGPALVAVPVIGAACAGVWLVLAPAAIVLLITHELAGLEEVDEIMVLDRGGVVERGWHPELMQHRGLYHRLQQPQAGGR